MFSRSEELIWEAKRFADRGKPFNLDGAAKSGGKPPTIESSQYKLFTTSLSQRVCKDALDIQGHEGTIMEGQNDAPLRGRFEGAYRATMNETVGGVSSEIQKNIIARRQLGLPKNF